MKATQSEIEIQEQLMEVVERNTVIAEQRALQEEEDSALVTCELQYVTEHYNSERERTKLLEEEERELRDAIADAQHRERHLAKEGIFHFNLFFNFNLLFSFYFILKISFIVFSSRRWFGFQAHEAIEKGIA